MKENTEREGQGHTQTPQLLLTKIKISQNTPNNISDKNYQHKNELNFEIIYHFKAKIVP